VWPMTGLPACSDDLCGMIGLPVWHSRRTRTGERESQGSPGEAAGGSGERCTDLDQQQNTARCMILLKM
jgi:hypothetical protein